MEHSFNIEHAKKYSVDIAIVIAKLLFIKSQQEKFNLNFSDGKTWIYKSIEKFERTFPYWNYAKIMRTLKQMVNENIIIESCQNASQFDRTKSYSFTYQFLEENSL